eukprot:6214363-Pleurochrysis_carterae.AAC.2
MSLKPREGCLKQRSGAFAEGPHIDLAARTGANYCAKSKHRLCRVHVARGSLGRWVSVLRRSVAMGDQHMLWATQQGYAYDACMYLKL